MQKNNYTFNSDLKKNRKIAKPNPVFVLYLPSSAPYAPFFLPTSVILYNPRPQHLNLPSPCSFHSRLPPFPLLPSILPATNSRICTTPLPTTCLSAAPPLYRPSPNPSLPYLLLLAD